MTRHQAAIGAGLGLAVACSIAVGVAAIDRASSVQGEIAATRHALDVTRELQAALIPCTDLETAMRGFVTTGDAALLGPGGDRSASRVLRTLRDLVASDTGQPSRVDELEALLDDHASSAEALVVLRRVHGADAAAASMRMHASERHVDQARTIADTIAGETRRHLEAARRDAERSAAVTRAITIGGLLGAVLGVALAGHSLRADSRERPLARADRAQDDDVERRVHARTREVEGRADEAQRRADAAARVEEQFLATASHELRTPINAIAGWAHILKVTTLTGAQRLHAIDAIERNARAQTRLIEGLLDVSQITHGDPEIALGPVDLRGVVQEALEDITPAAEQAAIVLTFEAPAEPVMVTGDASRLHQVAWNLLANGVKFTPKRGTVRAHLSHRGGLAVLRVEDTGEGIDPAFLPHVFETFRQGPSTAMRSGMGIGLSLVRHLVELHGGTAVADSAGVGRGAAFTVTLPLEGAPLSGDETPQN